MADQEFLTSFGVDIDESGVSRLQQILTENRTLAERLGASFDAASESVKAFKTQVSTDLPSLFSGNGYGNVTENLFGSLGGLKIGLNMTEPKKEIASFTADAKKPIDLSANAAAIVSAARTALEEVRSLFSQTFVLNVRADTTTGPTTPTPTGNRNGTEGTLPSGLSPMGQGEEDPGNRAGTTPQRMSTGGRFNRPTDVQVAEDGDAEYIIPVKKENRALPLLRQLLGELSPEARESLGGAGAKKEAETEAGPELLVRSNETVPVQKVVTPAAKPTEATDQTPVYKPSQSESVLSTIEPMPVIRESFKEANRPLISVQASQNGPLGTGQTGPLSMGRFPPSPSAHPSALKQDFSDLVSRLSSVIRPTGNSVTNTSNNLSAPVTINVHASGSNAEQIGETIYNTAERYLIRTMKGAFQ